MGLRGRFTLLLVGALGATVLMAWLVAGEAILKPFAHAVLDTYLDEAVYVAVQISEGAEPEALSRSLGLLIDVADAPLAGQPAPDGHARRRPCESEQRGGHNVLVCHGPRGVVSVQTGSRWVNISRSLDLNAPHRKIGRFLLLLLVVVVVAGSWMASVITRPLRTAEAAMARVAAGDLDHRLEVQGPKEVANAAEAFNSMAERVAEMLRTERALMAGISHELRTPLARLRLETELIRETGAATGQRLDAMEGDLQEVDHLIGELLEISRFALGERTLQSEPVELMTVVTEAVDRAAVAERSIDVKGAGGVVSGDHDRLVRVVVNLLQNAAKYAPKATPVTIVVGVNSVEVLDEGPGVAEDELARLFEPFYRSPENPRRAGGLGLGLMIAQQVVTLHGGTITASNRADGGLSVRFTLPA